MTIHVNVSHHRPHRAGGCGGWWCAAIYRTDPHALAAARAADRAAAATVMRRLASATDQPFVLVFTDSRDAAEACAAALRSCQPIGNLDPGPDNLDAVAVRAQRARDANDRARTVRATYSGDGLTLLSDGTLRGERP